MEDNFLAKGADSTLYTAKPLTFLPERSILLVRLVAFNHKEVLHDTRRILGDFDPLSGTSLGAGCVFFLKNSLRDGIQRALTGFAAGVMVAASVWSLLIPAMEQAADLGRLSFSRRRWVLAGHPVFAAAGPFHPASAPEQLAG